MRSTVLLLTSGTIFHANQSLGVSRCNEIGTMVEMRERKAALPVVVGSTNMIRQAQWTKNVCANAAALLHSEP
jgi:uridylate kinase